MKHPICYWESGVSVSAKFFKKKLSTALNTFLEVIFCLLTILSFFSLYTVKWLDEQGVSPLLCLGFFVGMLLLAAVCFSLSLAAGAASRDEEI